MSVVMKGRLADEGFSAVNGKSAPVEGHTAPRLWVMVADFRVAKIYRRVANKLELIGEATHVDDQAGAPHQLEPGKKPDIDVQDIGFMKHMAGYLAEAGREKAYDRIVLAAAPRALGTLRKYMDKHMEARIAAEISRDLTHMTPQEVAQHLGDAV